MTINQTESESPTGNGYHAALANRLDSLAGLEGLGLLGSVALKEAASVIRALSPTPAPAEGGTAGVHEKGTIAHQIEMAVVRATLRGALVGDCPDCVSGECTMNCSSAQFMTTPAPDTGEAVGSDLHLRAFPDGFRIYDGRTRLEGPWAPSEMAEALAALRASQALGGKRDE